MRSVPGLLFSMETVEDILDMALYLKAGRLTAVLPELAPESEPGEKQREKSREEGGRQSLVSRWAGFLTGRKGDDDKKQKP